MFYIINYIVFYGLCLLKMKLLGLKICLKGFDWIEFIVLGFKLIRIVFGMYFLFRKGWKFI